MYNKRIKLERRVTRLEKLLTNEAGKRPSLTSLKKMAKSYFDQKCKNNTILVHELTWSINDQRNVAINMLKVNGFNEDDIDDILYSLGSEIEDFIKELANKRENEAPDDIAIASWIESNKISDVKKAITLGADPNGISGNGRPLEVQINNGNKAAVKLLLSAGADINLGNPVFSAASYHPEILQLLIRAGANINKVNPTFKMTPLDYAVAVDCRECEQILIAAGAKTKNRDVKRGMWKPSSTSNI